MDLELRGIALEVRFWNRLNMAEFVGLGAVLAAGFVLVGGGAITIGQATAAALYFHHCSDRSERCSAASTNYSAPPPASRGSSASCSCRRFRRPGGSSAVMRPPSNCVGSVRVRSGRGTADIDLRVEPGETVAIVGRSGAGKSTMAALVAGTLLGHTGRIALDGHPVDGALTGPGGRGVALVTQEAHVFSGTLREDLLSRSQGPPTSNCQTPWRTWVRSAGCVR